jgi:Ca-activated chloride channel family protein
VTIHNGIAVTYVEQRFLNTEDRVVEALYLFPVPNGASVADFSMWINGVEMVGEVVEKQRARQIYESYKQTRRDPGLLEQTDFKTFEMRIFPIPARGEQRVSLTYYQELAFDHDWATYVYPLATSPREGLVAQVKGRFSISFEVLSDSAIEKLESPSHGGDFVIADHSANYWQASLEATGGDLGRDVVLAYKTAKPRTGIDVIASRPQGEDGYFAITLTAGDDLERPEQGADYVFVLDVSGSMATGGKLGMSRRSIDAFVAALEPEDRFEVVTFNVRATLLFDRLTAADAAAQGRAAAFLAGQEGRGGTHLRPAMAAAYRFAEPDRTLNVVVLSDGMTEQAERQELMDLIRARPANARVFCVGVGNDVERPLLTRIAETAGGFAAFVSQQDDFERQAAAFRRKVARPSATDVKLAFDGVEVYDVEPQALPNLYHGLPLRVYGRFRGGADARVSMTATVAGRDFRRDFDLALQKGDGDPRIERMWAWHRIQRLRHLDPVPVDEIVRLGEGWSIATEWTSFLVLENDAEYKRWKIDRRNAQRLPRDRARDEALRTQLAAIREKAQPQRGPEAGRGAPAASAPSPDPRGPDASAPVLAPREVPAAPRQRGIGAFDPWSAGLALGLAAAALLCLRRRSA